MWALLAAFLAFVFAGNGSTPRPRKPAGALPVEPVEPPGRALPSTLPPPAEPPADPPTDPPEPSEPREGDSPRAPRPFLVLATHFETIRNWLGGLGVSRVDREDVAQEVVLSAWRAWARFEPRAGESEAVALRTWLYAITTGRAIDHHRARLRRSREHTVDMPEEERTRTLEAEEPDPETLLIQRAGSSEESLEKLARLTTPAKWQAFLAHVVEGLPMDVIAKAHGIPLNTVRSRIHRAREELRAGILRERSAEARKRGDR
ncbi:MAG: RNA polymerase sigma factor [Polyangiaceae bacterium]